MNRVAVLIGSTRNGRFGPTVGDWFVGRAARRQDVEFDIVDLAATALPSILCDGDEEPPAPVRALGERLAAADAFVVVTPEYNRGYPAPLKTAIDWFRDEWRVKPVAIVSYGNESGGAHAAAQLRQVFAAVCAVPLEGGISLPCYWNDFTADGGWPKVSAPCNAAVGPLLDELLWWADALRPARTSLSL
jgi:NAD(P)H-dependent FMN reductase